MIFRDILYKLAHWETWHHHAKYIPLSPVWIWYCIRSRTPWFFTGSNPTLTFGGFEGEGKKEMYEQLPPGSYPHSIYVDSSSAFDAAEKQLAESGISYPFIAKPEVGMMGFMVRKICRPDQLKKYHDAIKIPYIIQKLVEYPVEVAAFYYRMPDEKKGTISGLLQKRPAYVTGDGHATIKELIEENGRIRFKKDEIILKNAEHLQEILPEGKIFYLSVSSNRSQAGILEGIDHEIDEGLNRLLDEWSHYCGNFFYGRYDIKCASLASLKQGKDFYILEFNGAGAGIQHINGNHYSLLKAQKIILKHWKMLFKISSYNHKHGLKKWGFIRGWMHLTNAKKNLMQLKKKDAEFPSF
jgi:hypothetical protein